MSDDDDVFFLSHAQYETTDKHLSPDGQYVPRIIFVGKKYSMRHDSLCKPVSNWYYANTTTTTVPLQY